MEKADESKGIEMEERQGAKRKTIIVKNSVDQEAEVGDGPSTETIGETHRSLTRLAFYASTGYESLLR